MNADDKHIWVKQPDEEHLKSWKCSRCGCVKEVNGMSTLYVRSHQIFSQRRPDCFDMEELNKKTID